jgi:predicted acyltransferase
LTLAGLLLGRRITAGLPPAELAREAGGLAGLAALIGTALWAAGVPFNKMLGTSSFVALATAVGATTLGGVALAEASGRRLPPWLLLLGRDALTAWVLLYVLVYYPARFVFPSWGQLALPTGLVAVVTATVLLCTTTVALGRRGLRVRL